MTSTLSRRNFLTNLIPASTGNPSSRKGKHSFAPLSDPLAAFVPDANNPWNEYLAGHLLRRTMMAPTWSDIEALVTLGDPGDAVDLLLNATSTPAAPGMANTAEQDPNSTPNVMLQNTYLGLLESDAAQLRAWWEGLQVAATNSIQEKMVAFWSGHFTSAFDLGNNTYVVAQLLYIQNQLFRSNALGNFQDLVKAVTLDGAMLVYLGGNQNIAGAPNENYARELMELFTCGISGGYTQADVEAAARILTGWQASSFAQEPDPNGIFQSYFTPTLHDTGDKIYLQANFPAIPTGSNTPQNAQNEIGKLVDTLFSYTAQSIATFICTKIYQFFIYSDTDTSDPTAQTVISELASMFMQNWEIQPVMSTLLKSAHFFDNNNIGCQVKTPAEYVIGLARQISPSVSINGSMTNDNEQFFQPPNVSGWPGYHDWLTTSTYPTRGTQAAAAIQSLSDPAAIAFMNQFGSTIVNDINLLSTAIGQLLLPRPLSTTRQTNFTYQLLGTNTNDGQWPTVLNGPQAQLATNIRSLLTYIVALPDFELC